MRESELKKRSNSWKGNKKPFLVDFEYDEWDDAVKARGGAQSRMIKRRQVNTRIEKEHENLDMVDRDDDGAFDNDSAEGDTK